MAKPVSPGIENARTSARAIKAQAIAAGENMSLSQAYEKLAKENGFRTWNAMKASLEAVEALQSSVKQIIKNGAPGMGKPNFPLSKPIIIHDEFGYYVTDDRLQTELRQVEGVPNATYQLSALGVFVFKKLVKEVEKYIAENPGAKVSHFAADLVPAATVSIRAAVHEWKVAPKFYSIEAANGDGYHGGYYVWHQELNARLPRRFESREEAREAFVTILEGGFVHGSGDFLFNGQPYVLPAGFDPSNLPSRPATLRSCPKIENIYPALHKVDFVSGFAPISKEHFDQIKELEKSWRADYAGIQSDVRYNVDRLWAKLASVDLAGFNEIEFDVPEYGADDLPELRKLYPKLTAMSDAALYLQFDSFQVNSRYLRGWSPSFDDGFLFHLLAEMVEPDSADVAVEEFGQLIAHALLSGMALDRAGEWAREARTYARAVTALARRTGSVMRFLASSKSEEPGRGPAVITMTDLYTVGRMSSVQISTADKGKVRDM